MKARYAKPSLTVEDQVKLLESRGMNVADPKFVVNALSTVSYYRLSAYSYPFRSRPDGARFREGTTFEEVWRYYRFAMSVRIMGDCGTGTLPLPPESRLRM